MAKKKTDDETLVLEAEAAEREIQTIIEAAAATGWEPVHVERAQQLAAVSAAARGKLGQDVPGHVARFVA